MEEKLFFDILVIVGFLLIAALSKVLLEKLKFPFTIGLVVVGVGFGMLASHLDALSFLDNISLTPGVILYLILPILIFEAAIGIQTQVILKNIIPILLLAIVGLLMSAYIIALSLSAWTVLPFMSMLLFGALISATDPVAVIALFEELGAPRRLIALVEGESLFNDATAIVLFTIVLAIILPSSTDSAEALTVSKVVVQFIVTLCGGLAVGSLFGYGGYRLALFDKTKISYILTISIATAYLSFLVAEHLRVSGVMSTLSAGAVMSHFAVRKMETKYLKPTKEYWGYFAFVANSFIFLLLGLTQQHVFALSQNYGHVFMLIVLAIVAITMARGLIIYLIIPFYNKITHKDPIPRSFELILLVGGLRGAVPVALVLTIPESLPEREIIIELTMGYILFTLLVQGSMMKGLLHRFGLRPEKSHFIDENTVITEFKTPSEDVAFIVYTQLLASFREAEFFVDEEVYDEGLRCRVRYHEHMLEVKQTSRGISLESVAEEQEYVSQMLSETVGSLATSLEELQTSVEEYRPLDDEPDDEPEEVFSKGASLEEYLSESRVVIGVKASSQEDIIRQLIQHVKSVGGARAQERVVQEVLKREMSLSTGLGDGVAVPHAKTKSVKKVEVVFGIVPEGVDFDTPDGLPVYLFVLILSPLKAANEHVGVMAAVAGTLSDEEVRNKLRAARSELEVISLLKLHNDKGSSRKEE